MKKLLQLVAFTVLACSAYGQQNTVIKNANTSFIFDGRLINCQIVKHETTYDFFILDPKYKLRDSLKESYILTPYVFEMFCTNFFKENKAWKIEKTIKSNADSLKIVRDTLAIYNATYPQLINDASDAVKQYKEINRDLSDTIKKYKALPSNAVNADRINEATEMNEAALADLKKWNDSLKILTTSFENYKKKQDKLKIDSMQFNTILKDSSLNFEVQLDYFQKAISGTVYQTLYVQLLTNPDGVLDIAHILVSNTIPVNLYYPKPAKLQRRIYCDGYRMQRKEMKHTYKANTSSINLFNKNYKNTLNPETLIKYKFDRRNLKNYIKQTKQDKDKLYPLDYNHIDDSVVAQATILETQFVFKDGFIEQILIKAKVPKIGLDNYKDLKESDYEVITFGNTYSIGISTFRNIRDLKNIYLFEEEKKILTGSRVLRLGDLIDYTKILQEDTRDYSPVNQKATFHPDTLYTLFKEKTSKLLEFRVYSDLAGIEETSPNGLIQTELVKRIVTNAKRVRFMGKYGFSWGTYIEPIFTLSKIENKFKYLTPDTITTSNGFEKFSSPLKLYQYQFVQVGSRVNLLYVENRINIFDVYLNGFFNFGITKFKDSTSTPTNAYEQIQKNLTTLTTGLEVGICFYPEKRYSFGMHDRLGVQLPLFGDVAYYSVKNYVNESGKNTDKWINTVELNGYIYTSDRGKIFARYRFNHQLTDLRNNFSQFQIGYSIYLLDRNNK